MLPIYLIIGSVGLLFFAMAVNSFVKAAKMAAQVEGSFSKFIRNG